ncbi:hypothetical protein FHG87_003644 [Trinorchestia longiramus]|nr:hypothetical protein FHG87_003644 [Trinorchestia longiramus]
MYDYGAEDEYSCSEYPDEGLGECEGRPYYTEEQGLEVILEEPEEDYCSSPVSHLGEEYPRESNIRLRLKSGERGSLDGSEGIGSAEGDSSGGGSDHYNEEEEEDCASSGIHSQAVQQQQLQKRKVTLIWLAVNLLTVHFVIRQSIKERSDTTKNFEECNIIMEGLDEKTRDSQLKMALLQSVFVCISQEGKSDVRTEDQKSSGATSDDNSGAPLGSERYVSNITVNTDRICVVSERQKIHFDSESCLVTTSKARITENYGHLLDVKEKYTKISPYEAGKSSNDRSSTLAESWTSGSEVVASHTSFVDALVATDTSSNLKREGARLGDDDHNDGNYENSASCTRRQLLSSDGNSSDYSDYSDRSVGEECHSPSRRRDSNDEINFDPLENQLSQLSTSPSTQNENACDESNTAIISVEDTKLESPTLDDKISSDPSLAPKKNLIKSASDSLFDRQRELISELNCHISARNRVSSRNSRRSFNGSESSTEMPKSFQDLFTPLDDSESHNESNENKDIINHDTNANEVAEEKEHKKIVDEEPSRAKEEHNLPLQCFYGFLFFLLILVMADSWSCNILVVIFCLYLCKY